MEQVLIPPFFVATPLPQVHRIDDVCLLSHSPSPQRCAQAGGVWDDSLYASSAHSGGRCLDPTEAEELLVSPPPGVESLETMEISVSHDGSTFGFSEGEAVKLKCIRQRLHGAFQNLFYPPQCAQPIDGGQEDMDSPWG